MVVSRIDKSIDYKESRNIDSSDLNSTSDIYYGELFKKSINFIIGQANYAYIDKNIIYFNIYLVDSGKIISKIGIYEITSEKYSYVFVDDHDNIDFELIGIPLIFRFVEKLLNTKYIYNKIIYTKDTKKQQEQLQDEDEDQKQDKDEDQKQDEDEDQKQDQNISQQLYKNKSISSSYLSPLATQSQDEALEEKRIFKKDNDTLWIEEFMSNNNYGLQDNEGDGDCLFAVIRDGLKSIGKKISVEELRARLANEATQEIFLNYKNQYDMFHDTYKILTNELRELVEKNNKLKDELKAATIKDEQKKIVLEAKRISERHRQAQGELRLTKELLREYLYMKNIKTLSDFKKLINSCKFWAETWAISTLERIFNIKLIILSSQEYNNGDKNNVLQCGQLNDKILEDTGVFNPTHYIIADYLGQHYRLITYKKRGALRYQEIPYDIKELIVNKCMERQAGPFYIIPDFREFAKLLNYDDKTFDCTEVKTKNELYDNDIIFQFYIRSNVKPLPGKGSGETIPSEKIKEFARLAEIKEWRKKLDNMWNGNLITLDGLTWQSVQHFYEASKFRNGNPDFYKQFSVDSGSELSKNPDFAKAAGGKTGKLGTREFRHKSILIDKDFLERESKVMEKALYAKFTQHEELKELLIATNNAKLMHYVQAKPAETMEPLMCVRRAIGK